MTNKIYRGRAQLRDLAPAGGVYEADYVIRTFVQQGVHDGIASATYRVSSSDIRSVNGYLLKNGMYVLEQPDGKELCRLCKTGALWELVSEEQSNKKGTNDGKDRQQIRA